MGLHTVFKFTVMESSQFSLLSVQLQFMLHLPDLLCRKNIKISRPMITKTRTPITAPNILLSLEQAAEQIRKSLIIFIAYQARLSAIGV